MNTYRLTKTAEDFILSYKTKSLLSGKQTWALPNSANRNDNSIIYTSAYNATSSGETICKLYIQWINKYAEQYSINGNIIAAQIYAESTFNAWAYSHTGALGLTQFTPQTIASFIGKSDFTVNEKIAITHNIVGSDITSTANRVQLHQNVMDNPELMIKLQAYYMNYIAGKCAKIASSALFCYNRGPSYARKTYSESILACANAKRLDPKEGIKYVDKIFNILIEKFGLKLDATADNTTNTYGAGSYMG